MKLEKVDLEKKNPEFAKRELFQQQKKEILPWKDVILEKLEGVEKEIKNLKNKKKRKKENIMSFGYPADLSARSTPEKGKFNDMTELKSEIKILKNKLQSENSKQTVTKNEFFLIAKRLDFLEKEVYPLNTEEEKIENDEFIKLHSTRNNSYRVSSSSLRRTNSQSRVEDFLPKKNFFFKLNDSPYLTLKQKAPLNENKRFLGEISKKFRSKIYHKFVKDLNSKISQIEFSLHELKTKFSNFESSKITQDRSVEGLLDEIKGNLKRNFKKISSLQTNFESQFEVIRKELRAKVNVKEVQEALLQMQSKLRDFIEIEIERNKENSFKRMENCGYFKKDALGSESRKIFNERRIQEINQTHDQYFENKDLFLKLENRLQDFTPKKSKEVD